MFTDILGFSQQGDILLLGDFNAQTTRKQVQMHNFYAHCVMLTEMDLGVDNLDAQTTRMQVQMHNFYAHCVMLTEMDLPRCRAYHYVWVTFFAHGGYA